MRFGLSEVAGSTQPEGSDSLRDRAFDAGSHSILFGKLLAGFSQTGRLQCKEFFFWPDRECTVAAKPSCSCACQ